MASFAYQEPIPDELICIFFEDTSYPLNGDSNVASERLKRAIASETGLEMEEVDIAPGYSLPAWLAELDLQSLAIGGLFVGAFFRGDSILKNLNAWSDLARKLKLLILRKVYLNRTAAASLAIDELLAQIDFEPTKEIILSDYTGYDRRFRWNEGQIANETSVRVEYQGFVVHAFDFLVDGKKYLVVVDGKHVAIRHPEN